MERRIDSSSFEGEQVQELAKVLKSKNLPALVDSDGKRTELPKPIFDMLTDIVEQIEKGRSIIMMPEDETFTTQAAANFLGVSRQHLVNLLEDGKIDFHYVGTHRRVKFKDLRVYGEKRDGKRREGLNELFKEVSEADKYDTSYTGNDS
jgi:excisionase family DNA binding protein